jgi:hypothetical protein
MVDKRDQLDRFRRHLPSHAFRIWLKRVGGILVGIAAGVFGKPVATKTAPGRDAGEVGGGQNWQHFQAVPPAQSRWIRILSSAITR